MPGILSGDNSARQRSGLFPRFRPELYDNHTAAGWGRLFFLEQDCCCHGFSVGFGAVNHGGAIHGKAEMVPIIPGQLASLLWFGLARCGGSLGNVRSVVA
jgi:hypothetical protein